MNSTRLGVTQWNGVYPMELCHGISRAACQFESQRKVFLDVDSSYFDMVGNATSGPSDVLRFSTGWPGPTSSGLVPIRSIPEYSKLPVVTLPIDDFGCHHYTRHLILHCKVKPGWDL